LRTSGGRVQTLIILIPMVVLMLGLIGLIPEEYFLWVFMGTFAGVVFYLVASFMYPFFTLAGKKMLAVTFYKSSSETEWAFGKIEESEGGILFRECPGGNKTLVCAEIKSVPFLSTRTPFRLIAFKFPEKVDPEALFDSDYVEPDTGVGTIPVNIAYLSGVLIGDMVLPQNTTFKSRWDRFKEWLGRRTERIERVPIIYVTRYKIRNVKALNRLARALRRVLPKGEEPEKAPIVLVTGHKVMDLKVLSSVRDDLKKIAGYQEVKGSSKAWVTELGSIKVISTELEELRMDNMKLRQIVRGMERIYQSPPTITTTTMEIEEGSSRAEAIKNIGLGVGIAVIAFLILLILGVV